MHAVLSAVSFCFPLLSVRVRAYLRVACCPCALITDLILGGKGEKTRGAEAFLITIIIFLYSLAAPCLGVLLHSII